MIRRGFFKTLFGAAVATVAATFVPIIPTVSHPLGYEVLGYRGIEHFGQGIIYCPYIPLIKVRELSISENEFKPK